MATVPVDARKIEESLNDVLERVRDAIDWVKERRGDITLEVPEPYEHILRGPLAGRACDQKDVCGDVGMLLAVFKAMNPTKRIKGSRAKKRGPRRK